MNLVRIGVRVYRLRTRYVVHTKGGAHLTSNSETAMLAKLRHRRQVLRRGTIQARIKPPTWVFDPYKWDGRYKK